MITDSQLIFVISQPRSGSSMLQQILMQAEQVRSFPEPWLMLPLVYTYKYPHSHLHHNANYSHDNLHEYLGRFPGAEEVFKDKIREVAYWLYSLPDISQEEFFLDKTPRYYHIIEELAELFPNAKFIFLIRNPLSVFASILSHNFQGNLKAFLSSPDRLEDLLTAPHNILKARARGINNSLTVHYETIVERSPDTLASMSRLIGVQYDSYHYELDSAFEGTIRNDTKSVHRHHKPVKAYLDGWKQHLISPKAVKTAREYIEKLGEETVRMLGYDYHHILTSLKEHRRSLGA